MTRFRLGLIQVNHDKSVTIGDQFPDDSHRFRDMFDRLERRYCYRVYMTIGGEVPADIDEQDGYLITGSPLSVLGDHAFLEPLYDFIRKCDAAKKPLIGTCFGHQAIAMALGGTVESAAGGWNVGVQKTNFSQFCDWMQPARDPHFYVFHEDQVTTLPPECTLLGSSGDCQISSFHKGNHIFTTQAHPEFSDRFMRAVVEDCRGLFTDDAFAAIQTTLDIAPDGALFAEWADRFFNQRQDDREQPND